MSSHVSRPHQGERGFVIQLYALMMLFIIVPMVGLAIDAGVLYMVKSKLQTAVDGAALGAARSLSRGLTIASQQASATDTAIRYVHANFPDNWMSVTPVPDPAVTWPAAPLATAIINVQEDVNVPTWFMRILGVDSVHLSVVGQATRRNVNVMMVIDRSGSLGPPPTGTDSCTELAADSQVFVTNFQNGRDRLGLVTFGTYYNVDFVPAFDFQTQLTAMLGSLRCIGWTNAAAAFWTAYQQLVALADQNALNVILFFTDGQPNTLTFGQVPGGADNRLPPVLPAPRCTNPAPWSGTVGGGADGIFKAQISTYPALSPEDRVLITQNTSGCYFAGSIGRSTATDVAYLPAGDGFGNSINTSLLGGAGFPLGLSLSSGRIRVNSSNVTNGGINALDNAAQRARVDAAARNMPLVIYSIGLGNATGGVPDELLRRIANDPTAGMHQTAYPDGIYIYSPDTAHLGAAFASIASDILRLSK